jgi:hypothetical protein
VGSNQRLPWIFHVETRDPDARFEIITRDSESRVRAALDPKNDLQDRLYISPRLSEEMPDAVHNHVFSVMFFCLTSAPVGQI